MDGPATNTGDQLVGAISDQGSRNGAARSLVSLDEMSAWMNENKVKSSDRAATSQETANGVDKQQLTDVITKLQQEGKDTTLLTELMEGFNELDFNHDGRMSKEEADSFLASRIIEDLKTAGWHSETPWLKSASQVEAVLAAGIGGEFAAGVARDSYSKLKEWQQANPGATQDMWQYSIGPLFFGETLRERLDAGVDVQQVKDLREFINVYGDDRGYVRSNYYQNAMPRNLREALDLELHTPGTVDKNGDGKIDTREMLVFGAEEKQHIKLDKLDQNACGALGIAIADSVPNPEWPFFEDLGWAKQGAFQKTDKDGDNVINPAEMNEYFKSEVWQKFDFRQDCFQHRAKGDSVTLEDVHWAYESADCFALADVGGKAPAQLVADALKGVENNWSRYAADGAGRVRDNLTVEQYSNALKTEISLALLQRFNQGVPCQNLKDYSDIINGLQSRFSIADEPFAKLAKTVESAAKNPTQYDTDGDGIVSAKELWQRN